VNPIPNPLIGRAARIRGDEIVPEDLFAHIIETGESQSYGKTIELISLELDTPYTFLNNGSYVYSDAVYNGVYTHAVVQPKTQDEDISLLLATGSLFCNVTLVPADRFNPAKPLDISWWRGGPAPMTDVYLI
jgi:hypothetical protein